MEMLGANQLGCAYLSLGRIVFYSEFDWLGLGGENVLPSNSPALGWGSSLCCPAGAFLKVSQLEGRSWWPNHHKPSCQAVQEHQEPRELQGHRTVPAFAPLCPCSESFPAMFSILPSQLLFGRGEEEAQQLQALLGKEISVDVPRCQAGAGEGNALFP